MTAATEACLVCGVNQAVGGMPMFAPVTGFRGISDSSGRLACQQCGGVYPGERVEALKRLEGPYDDVQAAFAGVLAGVLPDGRKDPRGLYGRLVGQVGKEFWVGPREDPASRVTLLHAVNNPDEGVVVLIARAVDAKTHAIRLASVWPPDPPATGEDREPEIQPLAPRTRGGCPEPETQSP